MPKIGILDLTNSLIMGMAYLPVALGSPGPFDKKIPSGLYSSISFDLVSAGTIIISASKLLREFKMLCLIFNI